MLIPSGVSSGGMKTSSRKMRQKVAREAFLERLRCLSDYVVLDVVGV